MKLLLGTACQALAVSIGLWATSPSPAVGAEEGVANVRVDHWSLWRSEVEGQPEQVQGRVIISYDLNGFGVYGVSLQLYSVDHTTGEVIEEPRPLRLGGDVGEEVSPGAGKRILWLFDDPRNLSEGRNYVFEVRAVRHRTRWLRLAGMTAVGAGAIYAGREIWRQNAEDTGTIVIDVPDPE